MNADQLREIRERHERDEREYIGMGLPKSIDGRLPARSDRAALLAEVDRLTTNIEDGSRTNANLRAEVDRLKALCGRAASIQDNARKALDNFTDSCGSEQTGPYLSYEGQDAIEKIQAYLTELRASK